MTIQSTYGDKTLAGSSTQLLTQQGAPLLATEGDPR